MQINSAEESAFSFKISIVILVSREALAVLKSLIYFKTIFLLMQEKLKFAT